jgi:hypothetical protein
MSDDIDNRNEAPATSSAPASVRVPSARVSALLAAALLAIGVLVGAAIEPAPETSLASEPSVIAERLPLLLRAYEAALAAKAAGDTATAAVSAPATHRRHKRRKAHSEAAEPASATSESSSEEKTESKKEKSSTKKVALPEISTVWLIELSGTSFAPALATPAGAPATNAAIHTGTLLSGWSALDAAAFAGDVSLLEEPSALGTPPLLHSIVQPPCPEGAAGAACAPETPGALSAADAFLQSTLATITGTPSYKEHGLIVITFATVGLPTEVGLAEGASSSTLTYKPPAGALLISPFVKAGVRSSATFNATSPKQTAEKVLHK